MPDRVPVPRVSPPAWRGGSPVVDVGHAGQRAYALSCAGCCVALMGVAVAVDGAAGTVALPVIVALAAVTAAERLLPHGRGLVQPVGAALLGAGALLALVRCSCPG